MKRIARLITPKRELILVGVSSFALGAGLALVAVLSGNLKMEIENRYVCTFKTPDGWLWPDKS